MRESVKRLLGFFSYFLIVVFIIGPFPVIVVWNMKIGDGEAPLNGVVVPLYFAYLAIIVIIAVVLDARRKPRNGSTR